MTPLFELTYSLQDVPAIAQRILKLSEDYKVIGFTGDLGSGKTTLIQSFMKQLGYSDIVDSPTYSIMNEYFVNRKRILHFDLYRLDSWEELEVIGFESFVDEANLSLIEWPEIALPYVENFVHCSIEIVDSQTRKINCVTDV